MAIKNNRHYTTNFGIYNLVVFATGITIILGKKYFAMYLLRVYIFYEDSIQYFCSSFQFYYYCFDRC